MKVKSKLGTLFSCPLDAKEAFNKGLVHRVLEYGSSDWDPRCECLNEELEMVQKREARFATRNYNYETGSMIGSLENYNVKQKRLHSV